MPGELLVGEHRVVDEDVRTVREGEDVLVRRVRIVLGVGDVADAAPAVLHPVPGRPTGMAEPRGADGNAARRREVVPAAKSRKETSAEKTSGRWGGAASS